MVLKLNFVFGYIDFLLVSQGNVTNHKKLVLKRKNIEEKKTFILKYITEKFY